MPENNLPAAAVSRPPCKDDLDDLGYALFHVISAFAKAILAAAFVISGMDPVRASAEFSENPVGDTLVMLAIVAVIGGCATILRPSTSPSRESTEGEK